MTGDGKTFEASGQVQDADGNQFDVTLKGYLGMHIRMGTMWSIEGTMAGDGVNYDLHYVALSHGIRSAAIEE